MKIFTNDTAKALRDLFSVQWNIAKKWWTQAQTNSRYAMLRSFLSLNCCNRPSVNTERRRLGLSN